MSKRGTSTRERRIDTIIDHIREPAFRLHALNDGSFMVADTMARMRAPLLGASVPVNDRHFMERFGSRDEKLARFVCDRKNAEALIAAIERIGSDKRRR